MHLPKQYFRSGNTEFTVGYSRLVGLFWGDYETESIAINPGQQAHLSGKNQYIVRIVVLGYSGK